MTLEEKAREKIEGMLVASAGPFRITRPSISLLAWESQSAVALNHHRSPLERTDIVFFHQPNGIDGPNLTRYFPAMAPRKIRSARNNLWPGWNWLLILALASTVVTAAEPVKIIMDVDMAEDVDDAGAVAVLHALADRGEAEILCFMVS